MCYWDSVFALGRGRLAFNIKELRGQAVMPVAQFGKAWAVTFRFKPLPVA